MNKFNFDEPKKNEPEQEDFGPPFDYGQINEIQVLIKSTGEIKTMHLDEYLKGVVCAEMPAEYEPEALNAQAVVARSYTLYKIEQNAGKDIKEHNGADICDDSGHCQAWITKEYRLSRWEEQNRELYWNKIEKAIENTKGEIITYNGKVIDAFFHANSGGKTEIAVNVWGGDLPYLQSVETFGEEEYTQYNSTVELTKEEFIDKMKQKYSSFKIDFNNQKEQLKVTEYTEGNRVKEIQIGNISLSGVDVRNIFGLKSANFSVSIENNKVIFTVHGYGHGVGMSQTGANTMAKQGSNYQEIIQHFYKDVKIEKVSK